MTRTFDVIILGSGFAGSLLALIARRLGLSVALLERGHHPRFAIGESSTPLANLLLEELTTQYDLPPLAPLTKWGTWQATYPELPCGLKRGFTFFHHAFGQPLIRNSRRSNELLVAASPHDAIADTHWYRPDFDTFLAGEARRAGVAYWDELHLTAAREQTGCFSLEGTQHGEHLHFESDFVVDATGPRGCLSQLLALPEAPLPDFPGTQALFTHFHHVARLDEQLPATPESPPYPLDDAAVHHVFPGGWIWVLRFNNGLTSAGVCATDALADDLRLHEGAPAWNRLLARLPTVQAQFADTIAARPFIYQPRVAFRCGQIVGHRWALLPSAAGFIDPLLSTGFPLTLLGIGRLAGLLQHRTPADLAAYARQTDAELLAVSRLVAGLYDSMDRPARFSDLSLLYFAAASYSETVRRLGKPDLAPGFLLHNHPTFGPGMTELLAHHNTLSEHAFQAKTKALLEPVNVAGLGQPDRRNWYRVEADDLLAAAAKLNAAEPELERLLDRAGFWSRCA